MTELLQDIQCSLVVVAQQPNHQITTTSSKACDAISSKSSGRMQSFSSLRRKDIEECSFLNNRMSEGKRRKIHVDATQRFLPAALMNSHSSYVHLSTVIVIHVGNQGVHYVAC